MQTVLTKPTCAVLTTILWMSGCAALLPAPPPPTTATAELKDVKGTVVGTATLIQISDGVRLVLDVRGLPPGDKAVHIHEVGTCDAPFTSAGNHFNPDGKAHGLLNPGGPHAGDLPNMRVGTDGTGRLETMNYRVSLDPGPTSVFDADGSALVVHAAADDFKTDPTGEAGARIACGVVTSTKSSRAP